MIKLETLKQRSRKRMGQVETIVLKKALHVIELSYEEGVFVQISSGYRSWEEQAGLYGQGRPDYVWNGKAYGSGGPIVTYARPGESVHNEGRAVDFFLVTRDGTKALWEVDENWRRVAEIAKSLGFRWGGDWTSFRDYPHLEWPESRKATLKRGDTGAGVSEIQRRLDALGYCLQIDGRFGPQTEGVVKQFQEDHAVDVDGIVGPVTKELLGLN
ncbi:M15 family metallopeptidase [Halobacillus litoralis]|uniref:peptidoglycan-binding protein n=1 Tax=Halobacillus litoralis TaxID=45668 RepID=UPI001CD32786|nr:peptidoglycan-binding protein [Halobacillus litoralis]MCA0971529.1 M15 family metallopeptidase [Halobacillus litoralis]